MSSVNGSYKCVIAIELGTETSMTKIAFIRENGNPTSPDWTEEVSDWPGAKIHPLAGRSRLPTTLLYRKSDQKLAHWGFQADFMIATGTATSAGEDLLPVIALKTLLPDEELNPATPVEISRREGKIRLKTVLNKEPFEVYEEFLFMLLQHVLSRQRDDFPVSYFEESSSIKLVLAFSSGWESTVHNRLCRSAASAMLHALIKNEFNHISFSIADVQTASDTVLAVSEWLKDKTKAGQLASDVLNDTTKNIEWIDEKEPFLVMDIGAGTGCLTPLRLESKFPPKVGQLGPTQSLKICGEAANANFEAWLKKLGITPNDCQDYKGVDHLDAGLASVRSWFDGQKKVWVEVSEGLDEYFTVPFPYLRAHGRLSKCIVDNGIHVPKRVIKNCLDKVINDVVDVLERTLKKFTNMKKILVLGDFGSSSDCLRSRLRNSPLLRKANIIFHYSHLGKLYIVEGALNNGLFPNEGFHRHISTHRHMCTLLKLPWEKNSSARKMFPHASPKTGALFEQESVGQNRGKRCLLVLEYNIPKGFPRQGGRIDQPKNIREHTWSTREKDIVFTDQVVILDQDPEVIWPDTKVGYTMFTEKHKLNKLSVDGKRVDVHVECFSWNLSIAMKKSGDMDVSCEPSDLDSETTTVSRKSDHGSRKITITRRLLQYNLVYEVTDNQVKIFLRALLPPPIGPLPLIAMRLRPWEEAEKFCGQSSLPSLKNAMELDIASKDDAQQEELGGISEDEFD